MTCVYVHVHVYVCVCWWDKWLVYGKVEGCMMTSCREGGVSGKRLNVYTNMYILAKAIF